MDGETWEHYGEDLEAKLAELSDRLRRGAYRPQPVRRVYIPKRGDAKQQRPIDVTALEDKIVQRATVAVPEVGQWLGTVVRGHGQYYGIPGNSSAIGRFRKEWAVSGTERCPDAVRKAQ